MWFTKFVELRNKTRGHGAITSAACASLVPKLRKSIQLLIDYNPLFQHPWAYLHRNLSGKYRVVGLGGDISRFSELKTAAAVRGENYPDGIYLWAGQPRRVELLHSDLDTTDFFVPNGAFNGTAKTYELHSPITDNRREGDASPYLAWAAGRPASETQGKDELDVVGEVFTNMPAAPADYVSRDGLEAEVQNALMNDRHPVVTLVGRGGIGKTSLALATLRKIASTQRYGVIIWFSARDIDLTVTGPKVVQPSILTERDIAEEYSRLVNDSMAGAGPTGRQSTVSVSTMEKHMRSTPNGATLFVFDNFETVRSPVDLFQWIDTNIRLPNKAVITSRFREFKADFPIEVSGMEDQEADKLISQTAVKLNIQGKINIGNRQQIIKEANGHPYIIKIILGEIANTGSFGKPSKILVQRDDILDALFDRTYTTLSPLAERIFLTLSGWRSLVPQLVVEAVLGRRILENTDSEHEGADPEKAIDELVRMSLVERTRAEDNSDFLGVPVTAALFGRKKLEVSPQRELIKDDIRLLQGTGVTTTTRLKDGIYPRMVSFFRMIATQISDESVSFEKRKPMLEFLSRSYPRAWLLLADLEDEVRGRTGLKNSAGYIRRFLEQNPPAEAAQVAWQRLISIYRELNDVIGGCSAFLGAAEVSEPKLHEISSMANWLNSDRELIENMDVSERGALFKPLAKLMYRHRQAASATDLSRLGWLYLHAGDEESALEMGQLGLQGELGNPYCQKLVDKLTEHY